MSGAKVLCEWTVGSTNSVLAQTGVVIYHKQIETIPNTINVVLHVKNVILIIAYEMDSCRSRLRGLCGWEGG
jgi:hypothetical protein